VIKKIEEMKKQKKSIDEINDAVELDLECMVTYERADVFTNCCGKLFTKAGLV
jgi:hypothetical protein